MTIIVLVLEGKANMMGCGTLSLPSRGDIDDAPTAVTDRLTTIKTVNLNRMYKGT